ncbi:MAG: DinB family protein, partial [Betaproteobacteria bacterium]
MTRRRLAAPASTAAPPRLLPDAYRRVRDATERLVAPLSSEDCQVQSMPDASPAKWHLAHVTWFFETFVLERFEPHFRPHDARFRALFNSYYQGIGEPPARAGRGLLTRPALDEVLRWRARVDERMAELLAAPHPDDVEPLVV